METSQAFSSPCYWMFVGLLALSLTLSHARAQSTSLLRIQSLHVQSGQPILVSFSDQGTGATNYQLEFTDGFGPSAAWTLVSSATVTDLGAGQFEMMAPDPQTDQGYYRIRALGGTTPTVTASFNATSLEVTEGGDVTAVINFSAPYQGLLRYSISGTVGSGEYVNLTGEVMVNGTSATIPVTFTDNAMIGQLKYLTLTLEGGEGYQVGAGSTTTITVDDNDAEWRGTFRTRGANLGFVLAIEQLNGSPMAALSSDQLGLFPSNQSSVAITLLSDSFQADTAGVPLDPSASPFDTPVELKLHLEASNAVSNQSVGPELVEGVGYLISTYPSQPHLTTTNFGTFTLIKPALAPSTNQVDLVDSY